MLLPNGLGVAREAHDRLASRIGQYLGVSPGDSFSTNVMQPHAWRLCHSPLRRRADRQDRYPVTIASYLRSRVKKRSPQRNTDRLLRSTSTGSTPTERHIADPAPDCRAR